MARIFIFFAHPGRLRRAQGDAWAQSLVSELHPDLEATLSRVLPPAEWDWVIEIGVADPDAATSVLESAITRDLLLDLRLLGSRPRVVVAG